MLWASRAEVIPVNAESCDVHTPVPHVPWYISRCIPSVINQTIYNSRNIITFDGTGVSCLLYPVSLMLCRHTMYKVYLMKSIISPASRPMACP